MKPTRRAVESKPKQGTRAVLAPSNLLKVRAKVGALKTGRVKSLRAAVYFLRGVTGKVPVKNRSQETVQKGVSFHFKNSIPGCVLHS